MARKTKPSALKVLHGDHLVNPGRMNPSEAEAPELVSLDPPMELDDVAREVWNHFAPMLYRMHLLTEADVLSFAALCTSWSTYRTAVAEVKRHGTLVEGHNGNMVRNPAALVAKDALGDYMRLATEFGLTPSSRARIVLPTSSAVDPLEAILSG